MGAYKKIVITDTGNALLAKVMAGQMTLKFSKSRISSHIYPEGTDFKKMTDLQDVRHEAIPSNVNVINDTTVLARVLFGNEKVSEKYLIQNIGLYALDGDKEILFSVSQAVTPDEMPTYNGVAPSSFIYDISIPVAQTSTINLAVDPAGTATTKDIMDLDEKKVDSSGGDISATVTTVEEPASAADKYPAISGKGSTKTVLGKLLRWVKSLKADKVDKEAGKGLSANDYTSEEKEKLKGIASGAEVNVQPDWAQTDNKADSYIKNKPSTFPPSSHNHDERYYTETEADNKFNTKVTASGGDIANTKVASLQASTAQYPVPAAGDTTKIAFGKIKKFFEDIRNTATGACYIGQIVNNCVTNRADLPLSAAQGKSLMDLYTVLNAKTQKLYSYSDSSDKVSTDGYAGKTLEQYARFIRGKGYKTNFSFVTTPTLSTELPVEINKTYVCRVNMIFIQGDDYRCELIPLWSPNENTDTYYCSMNLYSDKVGKWVKK